MLRATVKSLLSRKLRLLLSGFAILLSVTFIAATFVFTDTIGSTFDALVDKVVAGVDVYVAPPAPSGDESESYIPAADIDKIKKTPGATSVEAHISTYNSNKARILGRDGRPLAAKNGQIVSNWNSRNGSLVGSASRVPRADGEAVISEALARTGPFAIGDTVVLRDPEKERSSFTVVGLVAPPKGDGDTALGIYLTDRTAQRLLLDGADAYESVTVSATASVSDEVLRDRIRAALGQGYTVKTGREAVASQVKQIKDGLKTLRYVLLGFVGVALFIGIFLIFNTFSILVAQRSRELALLRALGASRAQIRRSVILEAIVTALIGSVLGFVAGSGLGWIGARVFAKMAVSLEIGPVTVTPFAALVSIGVGVFVTVVSASIPAFRASRIPPVAAMRDSEAPDRPLVKLTVAGLVVGGLGGGMLAFGMREVEKNDVGLIWLFGGCLLILVGLALLTPFLTRPMASVIGRVFAWSVPGRLGRLNAARKPRRTAITAAAMMIGIAVIAMFGTGFESSATEYRQTMTSNVKADLVMQPTGAIQEVLTAQTLTQVRTTAGVSSAVGTSGFGAKINGSSDWQGVSSVDDLAAARRILSLTAKEGRIDALRPGEIFADKGTAERLKLTVGSTVRLRNFRDTEATYAVVGITASNPVLMGLFVSSDDPMAAWSRTQPGWQYNEVFIEVGTGVSADVVKSRLETGLVDSPDISVMTRAQYVSSLTDGDDTGMVLIQVMMGLAMMIAVLGVINTMVLSVIERTRELGMLRAIGLRRRQAVRMIAVESVVVSLLGAVIGICAGVGLAAAIQISQDGLVVIPWGMLASYLFGALVVGVIAAAAPAVRVVRLNVLSAVAYE